MSDDAEIPENLPHERVEYAVWLWLPDEQAGQLFPRDDRASAELMADYWNSRPQTRPECTVMERTVKVGPWVTAR